MREDSAQWLAPMLEAASERDLDDEGLRERAPMPIAEADLPDVWSFTANMPAARAIDWGQYGYLLRSELGWDHTYPDRPRKKLRVVVEVDDARRHLIGPLS
jgi:hypothetical protein